VVIQREIAGLGQSAQTATFEQIHLNVAVCGGQHGPPAVNRRGTAGNLHRLRRLNRSTPTLHSAAVNRRSTGGQPPRNRRSARSISRRRWLLEVLLNERLSVPQPPVSRHTRYSRASAHPLVALYARATHERLTGRSTAGQLSVSRPSDARLEGIGWASW